MDVVISKKSCRGFTLVELVAVLLILGVTSSAIMLRWAPGDQSLPAQADLLARNLRHTQAMALSRGVALTLDVQSPTTYAITDGAATIRDSAGALQDFVLDNGVTLSVSDLKFDSLGRPLSGASLMSTTRSWTLSGESSIATVLVQPLTGHVTVAP
ncbi:prepilin-type N-terminal cleavage/methylation domain-containing protein [Thiogranum longum]|uniref:Prepilin-type N-terminal cleavage/methylation domain-containing protein n=2 Tax=Thiogranum longum TaxID=1537524 RepID=A0A4R1H9Q6_9GAMM|nr:prepilin-type N-terminal cleavage/methylation domain-containing protein [Thiogranum longum]